jgi:membrane protein involved in colicin uptake
MLTTTEFVAVMRKFPAVKHPIVKTNAIAKNKDYKACHKLWNFIHTYTQVGYKVDMLKQNPNVSGEMKEDIYNSIVWNYAMLHNYLEGVDELKLNREKRKKEMEIREVRGLLEELVDGLDMPEERLRKLIDTELKDIIQRRKQEKDAAQRVEKKMQELEEQKKNSDLVFDPKEAAAIKEEPQLDLRSEEEIRKEAERREKEDAEILRKKVAAAEAKKRKKEEEQRRADLEAEARRKAAEAKQRSEEERQREVVERAIKAIAAEKKNTEQNAAKERKTPEELALEKRKAVKEAAIEEVRKRTEERKAAAYPLYFDSTQMRFQNKNARGK